MTKLQKLHQRLLSDLPNVISVCQCPSKRITPMYLSTLCFGIGNLITQEINQQHSIRNIPPSLSMITAVFSFFLHWLFSNKMTMKAQVNNITLEIFSFFFLFYLLCGVPFSFVHTHTVALSAWLWMPFFFQKILHFCTNRKFFCEPTQEKKGARLPKNHINSHIFLLLLLWLSGSYLFRSISTVLVKAPQPKNETNKKKPSTKCYKFFLYLNVKEEKEPRPLQWNACERHR